MSLPSVQSLSITSYCDRHGHTWAAGTGHQPCLHCPTVRIPAEPEVSAVTNKLDHFYEPIDEAALDATLRAIKANGADDGWHTTGSAVLGQIEAAHGLSIAEVEALGRANGADEGETKPSNPKDIIGSRKLDVGLVPDTLVICAANGFLEGALKYGRFNWRICGVAASIYHAAVNRHIKKWWNGQDCDPKTLVHHLDNAISSLGILRDAMLYGMLNDDRPPCPDPDAMARAIDEGEAMVAHLKELFKDHAPHQFTIADTRDNA